MKASSQSELVTLSGAAMKDEALSARAQNCARQQAIGKARRCREKTELSAGQDHATCPSTDQINQLSARSDRLIGDRWPSNLSAMSRTPNEI